MNDRKTTREQWLDAYDDMMVRVKTAIEEAEEATLPKLQEFIHEARDKAVELGELTRDEAEKVAGYLERDLQDAGKHLAETGQELGDWLRFDMHQIEERLLEVLHAGRRSYPPGVAAVPARHRGRTRLECRRDHRPGYAGMRILQCHHSLPCHGLHTGMPHLRTYGVSPQDPAEITA